MTHRRHDPPPDYDFDSRQQDRLNAIIEWAALDIARSQRSLVEIAGDIRDAVATLAAEFAPHITESRITIMPKSIQVGQTATAHITAAKSDGTAFPITSADTVALAAAVAADVTFGPPTFNADGSVDIVVTGVNADAGDAITATVDGVTSSPDTLTITTAGPATVTVTLQ